MNATEDRETEQQQAPSVTQAQAQTRHLFHVSLNPDKETTVVLLHGVLSSHLEWSYVIPHLSEYHILIPDLCGHSRSKDFRPATIASSVTWVADLIRHFAHNQRAHVVGMSMGGYVALELAQRYQDESPEMIQSVFATGAVPFEGTVRFLAARPTVMWIMLKLLLHWLPSRIYWYAAARSGLKRHDELLEEMRTNLTLETLDDVYTSILPYTWEDVASLRVRTLAIAGGSQDNVPATRKMGELLNETRLGRDSTPDGGSHESTPDGGSRAVVVPNAHHAWDLQFPELFGQGILAWIEERPLPEGFEAL